MSENYAHLQHAYSGHNNAAEYQVSSIPYTLTDTVANGDTLHVVFPYVTRFLVISSVEDVNLLFSSTGDADGKKNYFVISGGVTTPRLEIKCRELWIKNLSGSDSVVSLLAGLTNVPYRQFPNLEGENIEGIG